MKISRVVAHVALSAILVLAPLTNALAVSHKFSSKLARQAYDATGTLYAISPKDGKVHRLCTIWNVKKIADGYEAVSASHCATVADEYPKGDLTFSVSYDDPQTNDDGHIIPVDRVPARLIAFGNDNAADDVSLWDIETKEKLPVLPLGESNDLAIGEKVLNASIPFEGIDKSVYTGYISQTALKSTVPILDGKIHTEIAGTGPGSSGSAILSVKQKAVVGILVLGAQDEVTTLCVPVDVLKEFMDKHPEATTPRVMPDPAKTIPPPASEENGYSGRGRWFLAEQHGRSGHGGNKSGDHGARSGERGGPRNHQGPEHHARLGRHDVRVIGGERQIFWGGFWFGCGLWPEWVFLDEIYFVEGPDGVWVVYDYTNPTLFVQVTVI
jgi:Trypsin-like peptidase domain